MAKEDTFFRSEIKKDRTKASFIDAYARLWMSGCLFLVDMLSIGLSFFIAFQVRGIPSLTQSIEYKELVILLTITTTALFFRKGLYPSVGIHYVDELKYIVGSTALAYLIIIGVTFLLQTGLIYSRFILFLSGILSLILIPLSRYLIRRPLIKWRLWGEPSLIIGDQISARSLQNYFMVNLQLGIRPIAVLDLQSPMMIKDESSGEAHSLCRIEFLARQLSIKTVLVLVDDINDVHKLAETYRLVFRRVIFIKDQEDNYSLISLQVLDFLNVIGLQVGNDLLSESSRRLKRVIDVFGSLMGLIFLLPFLGLISLLIKLDSAGPIFYRQPRVGRNGVTFGLLKFRTMFNNSDQLFKEALENNIKLRQEWIKYQKLRNDPRITRVGNFLRKFSIDELPQLWNVLMGEMSLVGPRPFMLEQRSLYGEQLKYYMSVQPGMTGLWQVSGRNEKTFAQRVSLDREYIQRWSFWLDIYILLRTIKTVLFVKNTY